ncbi:hypothetical protein ACWCQQ_03755 [Streptomyces sp. NPDC002143]
MTGVVALAVGALMIRRAVLDRVAGSLKPEAGTLKPEARSQKQDVEKTEEAFGRNGSGTR